MSVIKVGILNLPYENQSADFKRSIKLNKKTNKINNRSSIFEHARLLQKSADMLLSLYDHIDEKEDSQIIIDSGNSEQACIMIIGYENIMNRLAKYKIISIDDDFDLDEYKKEIKQLKKQQIIEVNNDSDSDSDNFSGSESSE
jgi:hypothetical protein